MGQINKIYLGSTAINKVYIGSTLINKKYLGSGAANRMGAIESSCVFDLDATISASYGGTGTTWANYENSPADGETQTAYDFLTGDGATSTTYPAFNGSAGSPAAYWSFDGGDYFQLANAMTAYLKSLHKTTGGGAHWCAVAGQLTGAAGIQSLFATGTTTAVHGIRDTWTGVEGLQGTQLGTAAVNAAFEEVAFQTGFEYLAVFSYAPSTSTYSAWVNGVRQADVVITPNTSTTDSTNCRIGASTATTPAQFLVSGNRIYAVSGGNIALNNTKEALIRAEYETRHARSYTRDQTELISAVSSSGCVLQLDAHLYASVYKGGVFDNQWSNACTSPADGETQAAYDMPDTGAPPFVNFGDADGPRWNNASGDYWQIAANTTFLKDMHKTNAGTDFWFLAVVNVTDGGFAALYPMFTTSSADNILTAAADGLGVCTSTAEDLQGRQSGTLATSFSTDLIADAGLQATGWHMIIGSYSHSNNNWRLWWNTGTSADRAHTFAASVLDATGLFTLGATADGAPNWGAELDWKAFYFGNTYLTDAKAQEIIAYIEDLHGKDYTP